VLDLALERDLLGSIVRDKTQRAQKIRLGKALSSARDRHLAHYRIVAGRNSVANIRTQVNFRSGRARNPSVRTATVPNPDGQRRGINWLGGVL
jgi:hypothetical protein